MFIIETDLHPAAEPNFCTSRTSIKKPGLMTWLVEKISWGSEAKVEK